MIPITKTTVVFIHSQTSLFVSHILSSIAFRSFDMSVIVLDKNAQTCVIKDIVTSLIQRKFVEKATHKATTHAITSQIGHIRIHIAVPKAHIIGASIAIHATRPRNAVVIHTIVAVSSGFLLANCQITSITGITACNNWLRIGASDAHILSFKESNDQESNSIDPFRLFICSFAILSVVPPAFFNSDVNFFILSDHPFIKTVISW